MQEGNVIEVTNLKKKFKIYNDKGTSLKERLLFRKRNEHEDRWVLNGISFSVKRGEAIGLIGKNGCGKSTTLKMLSRIMYPTEGKIEIKGRVSSLLELGAGFHPDMSGRENIYTNAAIFGLTKREIDARLEDIIAFSELEEFIDSPVRTYSSGMYMRLAFSVAINVNADILLIDEILAVGDVSFQTKCFERLKEIKSKGTTIVIVSHSMGQIEQICDRCIWIENGLIREEGIPKFVDDKYLAAMEESRLDRIEEEYRKEREAQNAKSTEQSTESTQNLKSDQEIVETEQVDQVENAALEINPEESVEERLPDFCCPRAVRSGNGKVKIVNVLLTDSEGTEKRIFKTGDIIKVSIFYECKQAPLPVNFTIGITRDDGLYCYGSSVLLDSNEIVQAKEKGVASIQIKYNRLLPGKYLLDIGTQAKDYVPFDTICSAIEFRVTAPAINEFGILSMEHEWNVDGEKIDITNIVAGG